MSDPSTWQWDVPAEAAEEFARIGRNLVATAADLAELTRSEVVLDALDRLVRRSREALIDGLGFAVWRGLPVGDMDTAEVEAAYWALGLHLGRPGAQNGEGDLLGHVTDHHDPDGTPLAREYRSTVDIAFHCDAADAVGLLCLAPALEGGRSTLVSSVAVFDELLATEPRLAARLCELAELDTRSDGEGFDHVPVQPVCFDGRRLATFMHLGYFRSVARHADVELDADLEAALDAWDRISARPGVALAMDLAAGDLQLCSNHTVAHARTGYVDDPRNPRHLLRLWLTL